MSISRVRRSGIQTSTTPIKARSVTEASGLPSTVQNLSASLTAGATSNRVTLNWSAPALSGDSAVSGYVVTSSPSGSVSVSGTSASATGLSASTQYTFTVSASNTLGTGTAGFVSASTSDYNDATGGTTTTVSNYNGSGETWRLHTFSSPGSLVVNRGGDNFRYLVVGGGGGSQQNGPLGVGNNGGDGGTVITSSAPFSPGTYTVNSIGAGGVNASPGGNTTWHNFSAPGGAGGAGCGSSGTNSNITGTSITYGNCNGGSDPGDGGLAVPGWGNYNPGQAGRVFIAYRVG